MLVHALKASIEEPDRSNDAACCMVLISLVVTLMCKLVCRKFRMERMMRMGPILESLHNYINEMGREAISAYGMVKYALNTETD